MRFYLSALWEVISHFGQLQFFVYLWLVIMFVGWWKNNLTAQRLWIVTTYVGLTMLIFVVAMYYHLIVVIEHVPITGTTAAMATFYFISFVGGLWTARAINKLSIKQRGWMFTGATQLIRRFAVFLEERVDLIQILRNIADKLEYKATTRDPLHRVQKTLDLIEKDV